MTFKEIQIAADVPVWEAELNGNRPERRLVVQHIVQQVAVLPAMQPHVLELCPGPGMLAMALLAHLPQLTYTGIDFVAPIVAHLQTRLAPFGDRACILQANLNEDAWFTQAAGPYDAIVSMQSLHDLGDEFHVNRIYALAIELLRPGGLFLNADLLLQPGENRSGRLLRDRHLALLNAQGYDRVSCTLAVGDFGCFAAYKELYATD